MLTRPTELDSRRLEFREFDFHRTYLYFYIRSSETLKVSIKYPFRQIILNLSCCFFPHFLDLCFFLSFQKSGGFCPSLGAPLQGTGDDTNGFCINLLLANKKLEEEKWTNFGPEGSINTSSLSDLFRSIPYLQPGKIFRISLYTCKK